MIKSKGNIKILQHASRNSKINENVNDLLRI